MEITFRVYEYNISAMVYLIIAVFRGHFAKRRIKATREAQDIGEVTRHTQKLRMEIRYVLRELINAITCGINRDHYDPGTRRFSTD